MRGYPKHVATKQDYINLLSIKEYRDGAIEDLKAISQIPDEKVLRVVSGSEEDKNLITEEIDNPMPLCKAKGFKSRQDLLDLINKYNIDVVTR